MSDSGASAGRLTGRRQNARSHYDRLSRWYDLLAWRSEKKARDCGLHRLAARTGERVLVVGAGTGYGVVTLARLVGDTGRVCGLDLSERMLALTRSASESSGLADRVRLACGDAVSLPFADRSFDAVFMSFTLELFDPPEIPLVLGECQRVLRTGGRICVVAISQLGGSRLMLRLYQWAHRLAPGYVDCRPIFARQEIGGVGFQIINVTRLSMWGLPVEIILAANEAVKPQKWSPGGNW